LNQARPDPKIPAVSSRQVFLVAQRLLRPGTVVDRIILYGNPRWEGTRTKKKSWRDLHEAAAKETGKETLSAGSA
jgi:hypothetical protein